MSDCEKYKDQISAYLAGQLEPAQRAEMESHLEACSDCQGRLAFMRGFTSRLSEAEKTEYPADVHTRLLSALSAQTSEDAQSPDQAAFMRGFKTLLTEAEKTEYPAGVHSRLTASLEKEKERAQDKVVPLTAARSKSRFSQKVFRYVAAAAILCVGGLGLTRMTFQNSTPDAVVSLVAHHDTCWNIAPSPGRERQYENWVEGVGKNAPEPAVSSELVAYDKRECPAGEVRGGHLLYHLGQEKVSVYILPADKFTASYGGELKNHTYQKKSVVLTKKGNWVFGVVAELPASELKHLVDTDHVAMLRMYLAAQAAGGHGSLN